MYRIDDMTIIVHKMYGYVLTLFSSSAPYYIYWFDLSCYEICETCTDRLANRVLLSSFLSCSPQCVSIPSAYTLTVLKSSLSVSYIRWKCVTFKTNCVPDTPPKTYLLQMLSSYQDCLTSHRLYAFLLWFLFILSAIALAFSHSIYVRMYISGIHISFRNACRQSSIGVLD